MRKMSQTHDDSIFVHGQLYTRSTGGGRELQSPTIYIVTNRPLFCNNQKAIILFLGLSTVIFANKRNVDLSAKFRSWRHAC